MSAGRLTKRLARVVGSREAAALGAEVRRVAAHLGIRASELRAEVGEVDRICRAAGTVTVEARVAAVARDLGGPAAWLREEAEQVRGEVAGAAD